jgi:hypothetical protein
MAVQIYTCSELRQAVAYLYENYEEFIAYAFRMVAQGIVGGIIKIVCTSDAF